PIAAQYIIEAVNRGLEKLSLVERDLEAAVDRLDDVLRGDRRLGGELRGQRAGLGHQAGGGHDAVDEADPQRLLGGDVPSGEQQLERDALAYQPRQALRRGIARNDAEIDLRLADARGFGGEPDRARHRQLAAAAQRVAVDRGDHGFSHVLDEIEDVLPARRVLLAARGPLRGELVDVGAS